MKQTRIYLIPILIAAAISFQGCATTPLGKAQQVQKATAVSFDAFLTFEKDNRAPLWAINHGIKHAADKLRHKECDTCPPNGQRWLQSAWNTTETYRLAKNDVNKDAMDKAIAVIQTVYDEISGYFMDAQVQSLGPNVAKQYPRAKITP